MMPRVEPAAFRFHPSSLAAIMSDPVSMDLSLLSPDERAIHAKRSKTDEDKALLAECKSRGLSEGAKTYLLGIAKEMVFGYTRLFDTKEMKKGRLVEAEIIQLYNHVHFTRHVKNTERRVNEFLSGECDIHDADKRRTLDAKAAWSLDTFPVLSEDAHSSAYEWQGRGYMMLMDADEHEVFYGLVDTPDEILFRDDGKPRYSNEQLDLHKVNHLDPKLRITRIVYRRDPVLEKKIEIKCRMGQQVLAQLVARIRAEHGVIPDWKKQFINRGA